MLYMLQLALVVFVVSLSMAGHGRAEGSGDLPPVIESPGVDMEEVQRDVTRILQEAKPALPSRQTMEEGKKAAQKAMAGFDSAENRRKRQEERTRVQKEFAGIQMKTGCPGKRSSGWALQPDLVQPESPGKERVYLFLSSSMPEEAVHTYIAQVALYGEGRIFPVFFGFVGGLKSRSTGGAYFAHMMQQSLDCKDAPATTCPRYKVRMKIDPALFQRYGISRVPSVVYTNGRDSWLVAGDATLDFLLEKIEGEVRSSFLSQVIGSLRGKDGRSATGNN